MDSKSDQLLAIKGEKSFIFFIQNKYLSTICALFSYEVITTFAV